MTDTMSVQTITRDGWKHLALRARIDLAGNTFMRETSDAEWVPVTIIDDDEISSAAPAADVEQQPNQETEMAAPRKATKTAKKTTKKSAAKKTVGRAPRQVTPIPKKRPSSTSRATTTKVAPRKTLNTRGKAEPKPEQTTKAPESGTVKTGRELAAAARVEHKALADWRRTKKGTRPATPNLDAVTAANTPTGSVARAKTKGEGRVRREQTVRFLHDGKPMPDSQNKLSSIAWYYTAGIASKTSERLTVAEFRAVLAKANITEPESQVWKLKLANGIVISTELIKTSK